MGSSPPQSSEALVRKGHLTGLKPVVLVTFQSPVNFHHWKIEQLQIQMEAAPFRSRGGPGVGWGCVLLEVSQPGEGVGALLKALEGFVTSRGGWGHQRGP